MKFNLLNFVFQRLGIGSAQARQRIMHCIETFDRLALLDANQMIKERLTLSIWMMYTFQFEVFIRAAIT